MAVQQKKKASGYYSKHQVRRPRELNLVSDDDEGEVADNTDADGLCDFYFFILQMPKTRIRKLWTTTVIMMSLKVWKSGL